MLLNYNERVKSYGCGCASGVLKYIKPPYAKRYYVPCFLHDNDYDKGGSERNRREADTQLFLNMQKVSRQLNRNPFALTWFTLIALLYYVSVRMFGWYFFKYNKVHP